MSTKIQNKRRLCLCWSSIVLALVVKVSATSGKERSSKPFVRANSSSFTRIVRRVMDSDLEDESPCKNNVAPTASCQDPFEGLLSPLTQDLFEEMVTNALSPFSIAHADESDTVVMEACEALQRIGLKNPRTRERISTSVWGYQMTGSSQGCTWPGTTITATKDYLRRVTWVNKLPCYRTGHLLTNKDGTKSVVDTSIHWAYGMDGYDQYTLEKDGVPIVAHLHGAHTAAGFDGDPDDFFNSDLTIKGPNFKTNEYKYDNDQPATLLWYHDHALGITRYNVYAGMVGFYVIRDDQDTGRDDNSYNLPVYPYEVLLAIQDRMFKENGELFYPAFPCDPYYETYITEEGACPPLDAEGNQAATGMAEFFGDFIAVNGKIWPKMLVEPRNYRLRLLNGCDSRFLVVEFCIAANPVATDCRDSKRLPFNIIGTDQGLGLPKLNVYQFIMETGSRYDIIFDFKQVPFGSRIVMKNLGGDEPFGGTVPGNLVFNYTDRIMAFDVLVPLKKKGSTRGEKIDYGKLGIDNRVDGMYKNVDNVRRVGLFEGRDDRGRILPLLGTVGNVKVMDSKGTSLDGSLSFDRTMTENPILGSTEEWEIWNFSEDAHPIHPHLIWFEVIGRWNIDFSQVMSGEEISEIPLLHMDGDTMSSGIGQRVEFVTGNPKDAVGERIYPNGGPQVEYPLVDFGMRRDVVTTLPGTITKIRAKFDRPGPYVWHCHILSHEDHDMMREFQVRPGGQSTTTGQSTTDGGVQKEGKKALRGKKRLTHRHKQLGR